MPESEPPSFHVATFSMESFSPDVSSALERTASTPMSCDTK